MSKFKVGDRVRIVNDYGWQGIMATVIDTDTPFRPRIKPDDGSRYDHNGMEISECYRQDAGTWPESKLELVEAAKPAIDAHYTKYAIQPMEFSLANKLDAAQHTVIKYTVRYRDKGGIRDLRAAIRVLELMIEREEKAQANG